MIIGTEVTINSTLILGVNNNNNNLNKIQKNNDNSHDKIKINHNKSDNKINIMQLLIIIP